ncbi:MAG TPA: carboxypeptidase-like regulatory domain-containing protein, partial [Syntrophales bacterium]|nr:carboxypeptidase-like regulatory domain-containing protein [Syntrophales bacterium]
MAIVLTAVLFFTPLAAQRATLALDDLITTGKTQLFQKSVPGALGAYQTFLGAANDPAYSTATAQQKIQIRGYLAFTRIFDVILRNDGGTTDTLTELLGKYGVTRTGNTLETLTFQPTFNKDHKLVLPPTAPGGEAIRSFLAGPFLTALNASIADMDEVINQCGAGEGVVIIEKNYISAGETLNVEVDAGDYYLYRAALKALKAWALIVSAYNLDVSVQEIVGLANADLLNFKGLLERYPNLLKLLTAGGTPAYNGAAKLAEAKAALQGAIADYLVASNKIRNYGPATAGAKKLFTIEMPDRQREQFFREGILNKVSASLTGGTPFELVTDTETWEFTSTSPASSHKVTVNLKELQSKGDVRTDGYIFNDYMGFTGTWGTKIDYTLVQGSDFVLRFHVPGYSVPGQVYYNTVEFRGTISGTSMTGTYRTGLYSQSWEELTYRGNFTAVRTAYDDSRRERINPNALLGNGTTAPSLRDLLPEFTDYGWGNPKIGTMGHGLGNDATLYGLLPDFTQNRWAKDFGDILQYSGLTGGIPVVANGAIVVDGLVGDWAGINPVYNNTVGDNDNDPGRNIAQVWLAQDANFLYLRMDTAGSRLNPNTMYDYAVRFTTRPGDGPEMAGDVRVWARYAGYNDTWQLNIPAQNGQPARTLTMSAWGANEWGSYQTGQGFISGPQGDPVFPSPTSPAPLNNGWMSTGGGWFNFSFTSGTNTYYVSGSADTGGNISGASVSVYLNGAWNSSYANVTGTRTAHAPFWQTFLSRAASSPQGVSYGPWEDLNNSGGTFVNMSAGLENHVEWKVPRSQIGPVAGLFIQPETRVWGSWGRPGVENRTSIQIGPDQGASLASITGSVTVPSFDGTGEVIISVYEYHNFQKTAEYLLGTLVIPAAQFVNGMTYTIPNLPAGKRVFVTVDWTRGNTSGQPGPGDYTNFSLPFTTTAGATTQNITAADDHPAYPAPQFTSAKVSSIRQTNTTAATLQYALYAEIAGGSPEDLAVTVTGPNGARFTLTPMTTTFFDGGKQTFGWYYMGTSSFPDGDYTFEAVDSLGRKAVVTRNFTFNGALPLIDPAGLTPTSAQPYTGTVTPTFTWNLPGTLPANYRIHVRVLDAFNSANGTGGATIMYQSANLPPTTTSLTVPAGILQPETWYSWSVQIIDGDDRVTNMARTFGYAFYTGNYAASPAITWGTILTQPPTGTITEYRHMAYGAIPGVYPGEIVSGRVKDASGNTINASLRVARGYETKKYGSGAFYIVYGSDAPLPNGNYKIELTINRGGTPQVIESAALPYTYHNTGAPDISALTPANNYYFNTTTPTLSWPLVAASDIWYRARVWDPLRRVEIAHSGWMKDTTSWTVPAGKLARGMSYYWTLQTSADWDPAKPAATGQLNSFNFVNFEGNPANRAMFLFTINPEEATTYQLSVSRDGSGTGTITSSPAGIDCGGTCAAAFAPGLVSLTATPDYGFYFAGWTGCDAVTGNQCVINMNGAKAVKATFTGTPPFIAVSGIVKDWNGNVIPGGVTVSLVSDPMVTTTASPADGSFNLTGVPMNTPFSLKFSAPGYLDTYTVNVGGQSSNVNISSDNYGGSGPVFMPTSFDLLAFGALPDPNKAVITGRVSDQTFRYSTYVAGAVVTAQGLNATYPVKYRDPFGNLVDSASTWGNGRYYVLNVDPEDTVTLTAQKANWTFAPRTFNTHENAHSQGRIYGTAPGYDASVSGYVKSFTTGAAIAGATLSLYGDPGKTVNSTGDGSYTMTGLPRDAQFYMKVTAAGYVDAY